MGLILLQPDAGSALIFLSFLILLYREGLSQNYFLVGFIVATVLLISLMYEPLYVSTGLIITSFTFLAYNYSSNRLYWILAALAAGAGIAFTAQQYPVEARYGSLGILAGISLAHWLKGRTRLVSLNTLALVVCLGLSYAANYSFNNFLKSHQQDRINVWLRPDKCDPRGLLI